MDNIILNICNVYFRIKGMITKRLGTQFLEARDTFAALEQQNNTVKEVSNTLEKFESINIVFLQIKIVNT